MANYNFYATCFFPGCANTSISSPGKLFFSVPKGEKRKQWCSAVGRTKALSDKTSCYCCQDHFKVEEDVVFWNVYQILSEEKKKTFRLKLKPDAVPRCFKIEQNESSANINCHETVFVKDPALGEPMATLQSSANIDCHETVFVKDPALGEPMATLSKARLASPKRPKLQMSEVYTVSYCPPATQISKNQETESCRTTEFCCPSISKTRKRKTEETCTPVTSKNLPPKRRRVEAKDDIYVYDFSQNSNASSSAPEYLSQGSSDQEEFKMAYLKAKAQEFNMKMMEKKPRLYLGLSPTTMGLIASLEEFTKLSKVDIFLAFRKIRLNESFDLLSDIFGLSIGAISKKIHTSIPLISAFLKKFVFWPDREIIQANVPIAFRARYGNVESIIDCFEVQIKKLSDALHQSLTWSRYKASNTIKFLLSSTPEGFINFISCGFGGRASDTIMVKNSGFLDCLKPQTVVMADRGFKHVENALIEKIVAY